MKRNIFVFLFLFVFFLGLPVRIIGNDNYETERLRAKGKWIYALGAVPGGCIGSYNVGLGFMHCVGDEDSGIAYLLGIEIDYSGGRGNKMEKLKETGKDGWPIIRISEGSFYFIYLKAIVGVYLPNNHLSAYLLAGTAFWQSKLKNWGNFPSIFGIGFKWYPSNRIAIRVAELRFATIVNPTRNTLYTYDPSYEGSGFDTLGLGWSVSSGFELRW